MSLSTLDSAVAEVVVEEVQALLGDEEDVVRVEVRHGGALGRGVAVGALPDWLDGVGDQSRLTGA